MTEGDVLELARKIAAVPGPESFKGGADHRQAHIQVILNEALGVGGKPATTYAELSAKALISVREIAKGALAFDTGGTVDRSAINILQLAWADAVRAEWQGFVDANPELKAQHAIARELMREDGYGTQGADGLDPEPICGLPGAKPYVAVVDGKEAVCFNFSMGQATPLAAIYTNKVRIVQSAAARVAQKLTEEAVKQPPEWPITIASGETFNSIEEMERSPIDAVREMAKAMRKGAQYGGPQ